MPWVQEGLFQAGVTHVNNAAGVEFSQLEYYPNVGLFAGPLTAAISESSQIPTSTGGLVQLSWRIGSTLPIVSRSSQHLFLPPKQGLFFPLPCPLTPGNHRLRTVDGGHERRSPITFPTLQAICSHLGCVGFDCPPLRVVELHVCLICTKQRGSCLE